VSPASPHEQADRHDRHGPFPRYFHERPPFPMPSLTLQHELAGNLIVAGAYVKNEQVKCRRA
jgi:hypothetical protein